MTAAKVKIAVGIDCRDKLGSHIEQTLLQQYDGPDIRVLPINCRGNYYTKRDVQKGAERVLNAVRMLPSDYYIGICSWFIRRRVMVDQPMVMVPYTSLVLIDSVGIIHAELNDYVGHYLPWSARGVMPGMPNDLLDIIASMVANTVGP